MCVCVYVCAYVLTAAAPAGDLKRDLRFIVPLSDLLPAAFSIGISFNCDKNNQWNIFIYVPFTRKSKIFQEFCLRISYAMLRFIKCSYKREL